MPDLATDDQRFTIFNLFGSLNSSSDVEQIRTYAARILKLDYLPDLRELTKDQADKLIGELRRALADRAVGE